VDRHPDAAAWSERVLQAREAGVGVDEDRVEVRVDQPRRALLVAVLVAPPAHEDVAQAARADRAAGARGLEQRHDLARELGPAEREQLDENDRGADAVERVEDAHVALAPGLLDVEALVVADEAPVRADAERRQRDDIDAARWRDPVRQRAAAHEHDAEALGQLGAQRVRAHEVPEADRVLAVEEQRHTGNASAALSSSRRRGSSSGRTRLTAGSATRASTAAAVCQRSVSQAGRSP
jgi:hypothetical protein